MAKYLTMQKVMCFKGVQFLISNLLLLLIFMLLLISNTQFCALTAICYTSCLSSFTWRNQWYLLSLHLRELINTDNGSTCLLACNCGLRPGLMEINGESEE